jgi:hypothetical protein
MSHCGGGARMASHTGSLQKEQAFEIEWHNLSIIEPTKSTLDSMRGLITASDRVSAQTFLPSDGFFFL